MDFGKSSLLLLQRYLPVLLVMAAWQAVKLHREQQALTKTIDGQQLLLARWQLLLLLWDHLGV